MNRKAKKVLFIGAIAFGISAMIPEDASAQVFRGHRAPGRHCSPLRYSPSVDQGACYGQSDMPCSSETHVSIQSSICSETISNSGSYRPQVYGTTPQGNMNCSKELNLPRTSANPSGVPSANGVVPNPPIPRDR